MKDVASNLTNAGHCVNYLMTVHLGLAMTLNVTRPFVIPDPISVGPTLLPSGTGCAGGIQQLLWIIGSSPIMTKGIQRGEIYKKMVGIYLLNPYH